MASFGENLRQARQARNITLQEIAASTKISSRALQALEDEHFEQLPGGIFNKGFVRAYARCVGLDEEKTVAEYMVAAKVEPSEIDMEVMSTQVAAAAATRQPWTPNAGTVVGVLAVIVALGMGALWLNEQRKENRNLLPWRKPENVAAVNAVPATPPPAASDQNSLPNAPKTEDTNANPSAPSPVATDGTSQVAATNVGSASSAVVPPAQPAALPGTSPAPQPDVPKPAKSTTPVGVSPSAAAPASATSGTGAAHAKGTAPVEVSISATSRVWISVSSDGNTVETLTLDPEKPDARTRSYSAKEKLLLVVGNPAGLSVTYNGKPAGTLGHSGQRATITFTPEGIEKQ